MSLTAVVAFLSNPIWQFIGVASSITIGVASIIITVCHQRRRKEIKYQIVFRASLARISGPAKTSGLSILK